MTQHCRSGSTTIFIFFTDEEGLVRRGIKGRKREKMAEKRERTSFRFLLSCVWSRS